MITHTIHDLRTADWRRIDRRHLRERLQGTSCQVVRWNTRGDDHGGRSYLVMNADGALFAVFFRRAQS